MTTRNHPVRCISKTLAMLIVAALPGLCVAQTKPSAVEQLTKIRIEIIPERLTQYAAQGDLVTVNLLIDAGLRVNSADPIRKATALHNASAQGHLRIVARLLELGADIDARDWHGVTPLIAAVYAGHTSIVQALLQKGADVNVVPEKAPTALIAAIQTGKLALVDMLLAANAKPAMPDGVGQTPLSAAKLATRHDIVGRIEAALSLRPQ